MNFFLNFFYLIINFRNLDFYIKKNFFFLFKITLIENRFFYINSFFYYLNFYL